MQLPRLLVLGALRREICKVGLAADYEGSGPDLAFDIPSHWNRGCWRKVMREMKDLQSVTGEFKLVACAGPTRNP